MTTQTTTRWTPLRKRNLVARWNAGYTEEVGKVLAQHNISGEEFGMWMAGMELRGLQGLRVTKSQKVMR